MVLDFYLENERHVAGLRRILHKTTSKLPVENTDLQTLHPNVLCVLRQLAQTYEILRHRYFLSEKYGREVEYNDAVTDFRARGFSEGFNARWQECVDSRKIPKLIISNAPDLEIFHNYFGDYNPIKPVKPEDVEHRHAA